MSLFYKTIADYSSSDGAMPLLYSIRDNIPYSFSAMLIAIFIILFAGTYYLNKSKTGRAKILIAFMSANFICLILSLMLAFAVLVQYLTVLFWAFTTILAYVMLVISDY